jgi:hypothetical protein
VLKSIGLAKNFEFLFTPANEQERAQVAELSRKVQAETGG